MRFIICDPAYRACQGDRDGQWPFFSILSNQAYDYIHASLARKVGMSVRPEMVYFGTLSQRGDSRRALRDMLGAVNARVFLDVNLRDPWVNAETLRWSLQQARVVKLNADELMRVSTLLSLHGETPEARASKLVSGFELERLVVTCGEAGAWTLDRAGRIEFVTGRPFLALSTPRGQATGLLKLSSSACCVGGR